jgi:CTP:molybdopterin cytidylyltransferase MocA
MGRAKMLLPAGGATLLASAVRSLLDAPVGRVVVVLGHEAEAVRRDSVLPADARLRVVVNAAWREGLSSSLRRGLLECGDAEAVLVALGDQVGRTAADVRRIAAAWRPGVPLVVPVHGGRTAHPVVFARELWDELRGQSGDVGGREVVRRHWQRAVLVECGPTADLDTPEDYEAWTQGRLPRPGEGLPQPD